MDTKLTLKLNREVIDKAKVYATSHKKSLSRMIESYLRSIVDESKDAGDDDSEISPFVKSMQTGVKLPTGLDHKEAYLDHLAKKYQ